MYSLGLKLAEYILRTEFSIAEGVFQSQDPRSGKIEVGDLGLPFTRWVDALPPCARAIRMGGTPKEEDLADILDIKYHILKQRISNAVELARKGLKRTPDQAYFYYAITLSADHVEGLRAAKKGLKCKHITPFVRFQLMQRAVEHAGDMVIRILQDSPAVGKAKWEEGIAFLMSALDDTKHALKARKVADNFCRAIDIEAPKTNLRLGQETVVKYYTTAAADFGTVIAKASSEEDRLKTVSHEKLEDDLAA
ncbi:hypothetical protein C0989_010775 [Termitomyces sp. Mn162]|nr:hypothetical protein C0989_010775 [Termitomyces sp. Mn162]